MNLCSTLAFLTSSSYSCHCHMPVLCKPCNSYSRLNDSHSLLTLNSIQQQVHSILVVTEGSLVVFVDLTFQSHSDLLGSLHQVVSLRHLWDFSRSLKVLMGLFKTQIVECRCGHMIEKWSTCSIKPQTESYYEAAVRESEYRCSTIKEYQFTITGSHLCSCVFLSVEGNISVCCHRAWCVSGPTYIRAQVFTATHDHLSQWKQRINISSRTGSENIYLCLLFWIKRKKGTCKC